MITNHWDIVVTLKRKWKTNNLRGIISPFYEVYMSRIKIMGQKIDASKPKTVPPSSDLSATQERMRPGEKHKAPLDKWFKPADGK